MRIMKEKGWRNVGGGCILRFLGMEKMRAQGSIVDVTRLVDGGRRRKKKTERGEKEVTSRRKVFLLSMSLMGIWFTLRIPSSTSVSSVSFNSPTSEVQRPDVEGA